MPHIIQWVPPTSAQIRWFLQENDLMAHEAASIINAPVSRIYAYTRQCDPKIISYSEWALLILHTTSHATAMVEVETIMNSMPILETPRLTEDEFSALSAKLWGVSKPTLQAAKAVLVEGKNRATASCDAGIHYKAVCRIVDNIVRLFNRTTTSKGE